MNQLFQRCAGIDISKRKFTVCIHGVRGREKAPRDFVNSETGFEALWEWAGESHSTLFLMEATGTCHEALARWLTGRRAFVTVVMPTRARRFAEAELARTKTDAADSEILAQLGLQSRHLSLWAPPDPLWRQVRDLTRLREKIILDSGGIRCAKAAILPHGSDLSAGIYDDLLGKGNTIRQRCEKAIRDMLCKNPETWDRVTRLTSIPGIGWMTAAIVLAETDGFRKVSSARALACFAGLDVRQLQSGSSVHGRSRISKMGNAHLRAALYMPALAAIRNSATFGKIADGISARHPESRKIAVTAIQRRLLLAMYSLWKSGMVWEANNNEVKETPTRVPPPPFSDDGFCSVSLDGKGH